MTNASAIRLLRLAPDCEADNESALRYSGHLATILNTDDGLPPHVRRAEGAPFITDERFLSYTQSWCREKSALSFAVVNQEDCAVGLITLSHISPTKGTARTGITLSSRHAGRGIGAAALSQLLIIARNLGVREVSGEIPEAVELVGHADTVEAPTASEQAALSQSRAEAARAYLISRGIAPDRITPRVAIRS